MERIDKKYAILYIYRELTEAGDTRHRFIWYSSNDKKKSVWSGIVEFIRLKRENLIPQTPEDFSKNYLEIQRKIVELQYPEE